MEKLGLSTQKVSFQGKRDSAAEQIDVCGLPGHTPVKIPGPVSEGASQRVLRYNTPSDLIGHQDEIADRMIQMFEKHIDLDPDLFFVLLKLMVEIAEPHRKAIDDTHFSAARQSGEHTGEVNGLLDRMKLIIPFLAVLRDPLFHFLIKGKSRGNESPLRIVFQAKRKRK
jgi:hypothetical protein